LREAGINSQLLVLFDDTDIADYFRYNLTPVVHDIRMAREFSKEAAKRGVSIPVHLKVDTGMGRLGFGHETAVHDCLEVAAMAGLKIEGLMSHFSEADLSDRSYALEQIRLFDRIRDGLSEKLKQPFLSHMANSAAVLSLQAALFDAVRPGLILYGCSPFKDDRGLKPLMRIKTRVLAVRNLPAGSPVSYGRTFITKRKSAIAVIPAGYADGYSRFFSNNAEMLVKGRRAPVAGRVCMDLTMLDVTGIDGVSEGDEVVILGGQGDGVITAAELSSRVNTIPYDILTSMGSRAGKEYLR